MNDTTTAIVDASVMSASVLLALGYAYWLHARRPDGVGLASLIFICLGPSVTFMHMWAHLVAVGIVNVQRAQAGVFHYDLRFYALLQMGVVLGLLSGYCLHAIRRWATAGTDVRRSLVWAALLQMAFSFPLVPFNPIGALPGLASIVLLAVVLLKSRQLRAGQRRELVVAEPVAAGA